MFKLFRKNDNIALSQALTGIEPRYQFFKSQEILEGRIPKKSDFLERNIENDIFWQIQEQRRAKAHSRQAKLDRLKLFSRLGLKPQAIICRP